MLRQRLDSVLLFFLVTVFLAVQGTPLHAHLPSSHDHGGGQHLHLAQTHAHLAAASHPDAIDSGQVLHDASGVVGLTHQAYPSGSACQFDCQPAALPVARLPIPAPAATRTTAPAERPPSPTSVHPHTAQPRAPPSLA